MGYPDFERVSTQSALFLNATEWSSGVQTTTGAIKCSDFRTLALEVLCALEVTLVRVDWLQDNNVTSTVWSQYIVVTPNNTRGFGWFRLPVITPYVNVALNVTTVASQGYVNVFADNSSSPLATVPSIFSCEVWKGNVASGVSETAYPADYLSGRAMVSMYSGGADCEYTIWTYDTTLNAVPIWDYITTAGGWVVQAATLPPSAWYATAKNSGSVTQDLELYVTMSPTGG